MNGYGFAIDRGGTFTDVCVFRPDGSVRVLKILSEDPSNYEDAPTEAIRRVLLEETGKTIEKGKPVPTEDIAWIRMGTTVATNALLERKGERIALLVTKGFGDLLFIGNQSRPKIFDLDIRLPEVLYEEVIELDERVIPFDESCQMEIEGRTEMAINGKNMIVERELDVDQLRRSLQDVWEKGIRSLAVVCMHSFVFPQHELLVRKISNEIGFRNVSLSHEVMPMIKIVPRGFTVSADAYLTPKILDYLHGFAAGFEDGIKEKSVHFMQSDGGLCDVNRFSGSKAILSGPAGGVVGISATAFDGENPVIGFDMGGTSTDVCRYSGRLEHVMETTTAGVTIQAPQLDIVTVAAGGGSRLFFRNGLFVVGPESAGAHPGPVCYKKGGYLTVTDANLVLGRIIPDYFPKIFGPEANEPLDREAAEKAMIELTEEINEYMKTKPETSGTVYSIEEVAQGFIDVANEEMCRPVRSLTQARGFDTASHVLASFGGAGGQHACAVARILGIGKVRIHKYCSLLSAYGIALADVVSEAQQPLGVDLSEENFPSVAERFDQLSAKATEEVKAQGFSSSRIHCEFYLHLRFERTDCAIMVQGEYEEGRRETLRTFEKAFTEAYKREFGFILENRNIIVDDVRVRGIGKAHITEGNVIGKAENPHGAQPTESRMIYMGGSFRKTAVFLLKDLLAGHRIQGPALIIDATTTTVVEPGCKAVITNEGNIEITLERTNGTKWDTEMDPIRLAIFSNRFMSIAEQMGRILQRTAISTNIKERLDFSCALFCPDGGLIANAPHIPVHLGGMQYAVRFQIDHNGPNGMKPGDVFLSNHPIAGGSHLPDFTVITPVFFAGEKDPVFFLANRGHHADIGGLVPGSMPPNATELLQEGAAFISFKLVDKGVFQEKAIMDALMEPGKIPGCSGTRNMSDNISDLKAQIAANNKGISLVCDLIKEYGLDVVQANMQYIQKTAEESVRSLLKEVAAKRRKEGGEVVLHAVDNMDDGTPIELTITIDEEKGEADFDFTGTGVELHSSCNAPKAVTMSAIIYCLRCLVGKDIPLNSGCLSPIRIIIPDGTLLSPSPTAAVVGGNVLTSQRLCDVVFKAFEAVAASQGCMNNVTFGDDSMGYYETIAGGAGAGPTFDGRSGVHTHMTNTRITDPEILETRYPVILREFSLRSGSGGSGRFQGGDGVNRKLQFRRPLSLSLLTERRSFQPYGLKGGQPGARGLNLLTRGTRIVNIGNKITTQIQTADILEIRSPGGGGYGQQI